MSRSTSRYMIDVPPLGGGLFLLTLFAATILIAPPAFAAKTVFGSSDAQRCFEIARFSSGGSELDCDQALKEGLLSRKDKAATYVNRGIIRNRNKRYSDAIEDFDAALAINSELGEAFLNRGNSKFFLKQVDAAMEDYNTAIEFESKRLHAVYYNRGLAFIAQKKYEEAEADMRKAVELNPDFTPAANTLARLEARKAQLRKKEAVENNP